MSAPIAATAERPRIRRVVDQRAVPGPALSAPPELLTSEEPPSQLEPEARTSRVERRHARRQRRLTAAIGLGVVCLFLVATVLVLGRGPLSLPEAALLAAAAADEKLGSDTVVLAMDELIGVVDAFVVTSGRNVRQVRTLVEEIEKQVKERSGRGPASVEGLRDAGWVLMDYGDFIVHVFVQELREFYDLEHLWSSAPRVHWQDQAVS